jgi:hypothetical protein
MKWMQALKWALPIWVVMLGAAGALMYLTDFVTKIGTVEASKRIVLVILVALPLITFLIKVSSDEFSAYRAAWGKRDIDERDC